MLVEESIWIGKILPEEHFPVLNVGSSTFIYRTQRQPFIQENIFSLFQNEKEQVIHLDMKQDEGIDLVGDLYDESFRNKIKKLKPKLILCNNTLMYLNSKTRKELSEILFDILEKNGYLIITNSHVFPPSPDPVEEYYRASPNQMYHTLFYNFILLDKKVIETNYTFYKLLKSKPKLIFIKILRLFLPFYKTKEWWFMLKYYLFSLNKNYSATCLFLRKK